MKKIEKPKSILAEAAQITSDDRAAEYGDPVENWNDIADLWNVILRRNLIEPLTAHQAALCLIAMKLARESFRPKRDTRVDLAGYAEVADRCAPQNSGTA